MSLETDRDRRYTAASVLQRIDHDTEARLHSVAAAGPAAIDARIGELDQEWDLDRAVELESSLMGLTGLILGAFPGAVFSRHRRWLAPQSSFMPRQAGIRCCRSSDAWACAVRARSTASVTH